MILVITNEDDIHADAVIHRLSAMHAQVFRLHPSSFASDYLFISHSDDIQIKARNSHRCVVSSDIRCVYIRRPKSIDNFAITTTQEETKLARYECSACFGSFLYSITGSWYSHPHSLRRARVKLHQLAVAKQVGLDIPEWICTNSSAEAQMFLEIADFFVMKPISEQGARTVTEVLRDCSYVQRIDRALLARAVAQDPICPVFLQRFVSKQADIRLTVIGQDMFPVRIKQPKGLAVDDWRTRPYDLDHEPTRMPQALERPVREYMLRMGLNFAAFDFAVDHDDRWWFLEANPNGQWLWLETLTRLPLSKSFAEHLTLIKPPLISAH